MDPSLNQVRDHLLAFNPVATPGLLSDSVESVFGGTGMKSKQVSTVFVDHETQAGQQNFLAQSVQGGVKIGF
jgi:hypothetical protein